VTYCPSAVGERTKTTGIYTNTVEIYVKSFSRLQFLQESFKFIIVNAIMNTFCSISANTLFY
jgi:hypothetical protein